MKVSCAHDDGLREEVLAGRTYICCDTCGFREVEDNDASRARGPSKVQCEHEDGFREEVDALGHIVLCCDACGFREVNGNMESIDQPPLKPDVVIILDKVSLVRPDLTLSCVASSGKMQFVVRGDTTKSILWFRTQIEQMVDPKNECNVVLALHDGQLILNDKDNEPLLTGFPGVLPCSATSRGVPKVRGRTNDPKLKPTRTSVDSVNSSRSSSPSSPSITKKTYAKRISPKIATPGIPGNSRLPAGLDISARSKLVKPVKPDNDKGMMSQPASARPSWSAIPKVLTLTVSRLKDVQTIGILTQPTDTNWLEITKVYKDGLIDEWNTSHRDEVPISVGDYIMQVNDVVDDAALLKKELQKLGELTISVQRNQEMLWKRLERSLEQEAKSLRESIEVEHQARLSAEQKGLEESERAQRLEVELKEYVLQGVTKRTLMPSPATDVMNITADVKEMKRMMKLTDRMRVYKCLEQVLDMFEEELRVSTGDSVGSPRYCSNGEWKPP